MENVSREGKFGEQLSRDMIDIGMSDRKQHSMNDDTKIRSIVVIIYL